MIQIASSSIGLTMRRYLAFLITLSSLFMSTTIQTASAQGQPFDLTAALINAQAGDTIGVPAGSYPGPLVLDKPLTLLGEGNPTLQGDGDGDVVRINAIGVTLRGFVIRGSGDSLDREDAAIRVNAGQALIEENRIEDALFGIYLANAPQSVIRNNNVVGKALPISRRGDGIKVWYSADTLIEGNFVHEGRDTVVWFSPNTTVRNNVIENSRYGLHFMSTSQQVVENNVLRHNSVGIYLMYGSNFVIKHNLLLDNHGPSGYGIGMKDVDNLRAEGNRLVGNRVGVYIDNSPLQPDATVIFDTNLLAYNEVGVQMLPNVQRNQYRSNIFLDNSEQIAISGGGDLRANQWASAGKGNYWSDYAGFDANGDHIGDLPYESKSLFEDLLAQHPELRIFQLSPATAALDLAAKAFPLFQPRTKMSDPYPLTVPPILPPVPGLPPPPVITNLLAAVSMMAIGAFVLMVGMYRRGRVA